MTLRSKVLPFLLTALLVAPACSSDDDDDDGGTGPTGDELSTVEFESMVEAMSAINSLGVGGIIGLQQASSPALAAQSGGTFTYSATEPCPIGGTIGLTGTYTVTSSGTATTGNYTITQSYSNCQAQSTNGTTWTFNGNPNLTLSLNFTSNEDGSFSMTGTETGGIAWGGTGKSGNCPISLNLNYSGGPSGQSYSYAYSLTGTVCGTAVNESFSYTA